MVQSDAHGEIIEAAVDELVHGNMLLVVHCVKRFTGYLRSSDCRMSIMDLVAEGNIALIKAAQTFDAYHGEEGSAPVRFSSYACKVIEGRMRRAIKQSRFIHIPEGHFTQWSRVKELQAQYGDDLSNRALSWELGLSMNMVNFVKTSMGSGTGSLEDMQYDEDGLHWSERIADKHAVGQAEQVGGSDMRDYLETQMEALPERTRRMLSMLYLQDVTPTLEDLSQEFGVSRERCRQVCHQGLRQLRRRMTAHAEKIGVTVEDPAVLAGRRSRTSKPETEMYSAMIQHLPVPSMVAVDAA
jgi:RNA polymerase sigma factor (sigma-70 family)